MLKHTLVLGATAAMHGGASAQTLSLNLADALAPVKAKMVAGQTSRIVVIGDSLAYRAGTWLPEFRAHLQSEHGDAGLGFMDFSLWSGGSFGAGWTFGLIGSDTSPHRSLTGMWSLSPPTAGVASYAAGSAKSLTLMIAGEPGAGSATIQAPGQSPVVVDGYLLVANDDGIAHCYEAATGEHLWKTRLGRHYSTSLVTARGLVYFTDDDGVTKLIRPGKALDIVEENTLDESCFASPAISQGQLFIRSEHHLFCIGPPAGT